MLTDFLGVEFAALQSIVYPVRRGSKMWLEKATVWGIEGTELVVQGATGHRKRIRNLKNVIVCQPATTSVTSATTSSSPSTV